MKKIILLILAFSNIIFLHASLSKTVSGCTANGLYSKLTYTERQTITDLTITGTIDARDFRIMRDSMPVLASIDLEAVTISAYTGTDGTNGSFNITAYPANELPQYAFFSSHTNKGKTILTSLKIPLLVTSIGNKAFFGCGLTSIIIPSSVTSIRHFAFRECTGLTSITFTNTSSVTSIGGGAFFDCNNLTSFAIPESVTFIGDSAFHGCTGLTSITIPSSITSFGKYAFRGCTGLTSITIPTSVTSIANFAFDGCIGLTSITIPSSVTSIGDYAFEGCTGLTSITIPSSVTSMGDFVFNGCIKLTSITISPSVTSIGDAAFSECIGLTSITIPSSVTSIGGSTFEGCTGLTSIIIPSSVTSIGDAAFWGCKKLTSITIPSSVTAIGSIAFRYCSNLKYFITLNSIPLTNLGTNAIQTYNFNTILMVPYGSAAAYKNASQWKDFLTIQDSIVISKTKLSVVPISGSKTSFTVLANADWTASSDQSWLSLNHTSGYAATLDTIVATATSANPDKTPRTAIITFIASGHSQTVKIIQKAIPSISWKQPTPVYQGTVLNKVQLNAEASVEGKYSYLPNSGTILNTGANQKLTVTFTPTDTASYMVFLDTVMITVYPGPQLCIVRYDIQEKRNMIVWERVTTEYTKAYKILREITTGIYDTIGTVPYDAKFTYFIDSLTDPDVKAMKYKMCIVDSSNHRSPNSPYHRSLYLSKTSDGIPNHVTLIWNEYEDENKTFVPSNYYIYRDGATGKLSLYKSQTAGSAFYSVNVNDVLLNEKFQIGVEKNLACSSTFPFKAESDPYTQSLSNIVEFKKLDITSSNELPIVVFPNPANELLHLSYTLDYTADVRVELMNVTGQKIVSLEYLDQTAGSNTIEINTKQYRLVAGIYLVNVIAGDKVSQAKVVVE